MTFDTALNGILGKTSSNQPGFIHTIAVWIKDGITGWYLGVIEEETNNKLIISFHNKSDQDGRCWELPNVWETSQNQEQKCQ